MSADGNRPAGGSPVHWDDIHSVGSIEGDAGVSTPVVDCEGDLRSYVTVMICPGASGFTLADDFKMSDILEENGLKNSWNVVREFESPAEGFQGWVGYELEGPMLMAPQLTHYLNVRIAGMTELDDDGNSQVHDFIIQMMDLEKTVDIWSYLITSDDGDSERYEEDYDY